MPAGIDPRLRCAVDASIGWYEDICALHGVGSRLEDGLWSASATPPPLHSDAVVVEPDVTADRVLASLDGRTHAACKDSFAALDGLAAGLDVLFSATWLHRAPNGRGTGRGSAPWSVLTSAEELAAWTAQHDTAEVLLPGLLERAHFAFLGRYVEGEIMAGAVARLGSGVVDLSNVFSIAGHQIDWAELAEAVDSLFPGRSIVGYEHGDALTAAVEAGFVPVGDLRVWTR